LVAVALSSALGVPGALATRDERPLSFWPAFILLMAWKDAFGCGVDREVGSSPGVAMEEALEDPAMLIEFGIRPHQMRNGA
jgi:hypothetical protein